MSVTKIREKFSVTSRIVEDLSISELKSAGFVGKNEIDFGGEHKSLFDCIYRDGFAKSNSIFSTLDFGVKTTIIYGVHRDSNGFFDEFLYKTIADRDWVKLRAELQQSEKFDDRGMSDDDYFEWMLKSNSMMIISDNNCGTFKISNY